MADEEQRLQHIEEKIDELDRKITDIDKDLAKYRGMVGGVLLVVTAIITLFKLSWDWLVEHIRFT